MPGVAAGAVAVGLMGSARSFISTLPPLTEYFGADLGVSATGSDVDSWTGQILGAVAAGSGATRPTTDGSKISFAGGQWLDLDRSISSDTSHVCTFVIDLTVGFRRALLDIQQSGNRLHFKIEAAPYEIMYQTGSENTGSYSTASGLQVITYVLDGVGGTGTIRLNGSVVESGLAYTPTMLAGVIRVIGASFTYGANFVGDMYALAFASGATVPLTDAQVLDLETKLANHFLAGMP